jgi:hypothetical protein
MAGVSEAQGDVKIIPRAAWKLQVAGVLLFGGLLAGSLLVRDPSKFWFFGPISQLIYVVFLVGTLVLCVRPPGVILRDDEMIVRQFTRNRHVDRRNVRKVLFELPRRVIGGEVPNSQFRRVEIVIWDNGKEYVIPLAWSDRLLGLMTRPEAQEAKATLEKWTGRTATN